MASGHAPRLKQEVAAFVMDAQRAQLAGYTKTHAEEMASFSTMEHKAALEMCIRDRFHAGCPGSFCRI